MIITVGATKGGSGKSTISTNLAVALAKSKKEVLLVDSDTQGSSGAFRAMREADDIQAVTITTPTLHKDLHKFKHQFIVIDAGGRDSTTFRSAMLASDILVIPIEPSTADLWATEDVVELLKEASLYREDKPIRTFFVVNKVVPNTKLAIEINEALAEYADFAVLLKTNLGFRVVYKNALAEGKGVIEMDDKKAKQEMVALCKEIFNSKKGVGDDNRKKT